MEKMIPRECICDGWRQDWTLSPPPETLTREILSPLLIRLSGEPGTLEIRTPYLRAELSVTIHGRAQCTLLGEGIRLRLEHEQGTDLFSCCQTDSTAFIIEADDPRLHFGAEGDVRESHEGSVITASAHEHHLVMLVNWRMRPVRMAIISGTGNPELLHAKARAQLINSAHQRLDKIIHDLSALPAPTNRTHAFSPMEYLKSRLRPASLRLPAPWLALHDEEPLWDMMITYLLIRAFAFQHPELVSGFIDNITDVMDEDGRLPQSGGHRVAVIHADASADVFIQCIASARIWSGTTPQERELTIAATALSRARDSLAVENPLHARAIHQWLTLQARAARAPDDLLREIQRRHAEHALAGANADPSWHRLLNDQQVDTMSKSAVESELNEAASALGDPASPHFISSWALALMMEEPVATSMPVEIKFRWQQRLITQAKSNWAAFAGDNAGVRRIQHEPALLVLAATAAWAGHADVQSKNASMRRQRLLWRINRRQGALLAVAAAAVAVFIGWLALVQMRTNLPAAVFQTHVGMIQQHYQAGEYNLALAKLDELERRRNLPEQILFFIRGNLAIKQERPADAIASYRAALALEPDHVPTHYNLGVALFMNRAYDEARVVFDSIVSEFSRTNPATTARAQRASELCRMVAGNQTVLKR